MEAQNRPENFKRSDDFEIDNNKFTEVSVDNQRLVAKGPKWKSFELMISSITAAWLEKRRKYGTIVLVCGIALLVLGFFGILSTSYMLGYATGVYSMIFFGITPLFGGILLVVLWIIVKRESILIYTSGGSFKFEGSEGFIEAMWNAIKAFQ